MNVFINGQTFDISNLNSQNLSQALLLFLSEDQQQRSYAVALNGDFIGKVDYENTQVSANDSIDVLFPIQGG